MAEQTKFDFSLEFDYDFLPVCITQLIRVSNRREVVDVFPMKRNDGLRFHET